MTEMTTKKKQDLKNIPDTEDSLTMWKLTVKEDAWGILVQERQTDCLSIQGQKWGGCVDTFQSGALLRCVLNGWKDRFQISRWRYNSEGQTVFLGCSSNIKSHQKMLHRSRCLSMWRPHKHSYKPPAHVKTQCSILFFILHGISSPASSWPSSIFNPYPLDVFYNCQVELPWPCLLCSPFLKHVPSLKLPRHPKRPKVLRYTKASSLHQESWHCHVLFWEFASITFFCLCSQSHQSSILIQSLFYFCVMNMDIQGNPPEFSSVNVSYIFHWTEGCSEVALWWWNVVGQISGILIPHQK